MNVNVPCSAVITMSLELLLYDPRKLHLNIRISLSICEYAVIHGPVQELSLQGSTAVYGNGLRHLSPLTRLRTVDLQQCTRLDATGLSYLAPLPRLLTVNVAKCPRIQGNDFAHMSALRAHPHLVIVGLEGACLETAADCGFKVASSPVAHM